VNQPTRDEALAHFGVRGMRWGVRKASYNADLVPESSSTPETTSKPTRRPNIVKPVVIFGAAVVATTVIGIGAAYASQRLNVDGHLKLPKSSKVPKIKGQKAIETLQVIKPKKSVYDIVSDKKLKRGASWAKAGKQFTEDVLIGNIGGVSIADLKK